MQPKKANTSFLYVALLGMLLSLGTALFIHSGAFSIRQVEVQGLENIPENDIQRLASPVLGKNLFVFDEAGLSRTLGLHPLVQSTDFKRKLPRTLVIQVTERKPSALVTVPQGVVVVDKQGVFLRRLESWPNTDYPVITGVTIPDTAGPGQVIANPSLTAALRVIEQSPSELLPLTGEVHINPIQQVTLYLTSGVEVRLGQADDWSGKLKALSELIKDPEYQSFQQGVRYIDFTAAKPVIGR